MVSWEGLRELFRNCFTSDVSENAGAGDAYGRYFERAGEFYDFRGYKHGVLGLLPHGSLAAFSVRYAIAEWFLPPPATSKPIGYLTYAEHLLIRLLLRIDYFRKRINDRREIFIFELDVGELRDGHLLKWEVESMMITLKPAVSAWIASMSVSGLKGGSSVITE
jgi:hypothetical protein